MNRISAKRILITCILICVCVGNFGSIKSSAEVTEAGIKQKESQIESARQEREGMKSNLTDLQKVQAELKASKNDLNSYVKKLDESLTGIQQKIDELETKITSKEQEIQKTHDVITPVLITNADDFSEIVVQKEFGPVKAGDAILTVKK